MVDNHVNYRTSTDYQSNTVTKSQTGNYDQSFLEDHRRGLQYDTESNDEEEAFWIFTMMVESMLPLDYYSNMVGVLID